MPTKKFNIPNLTRTKINFTDPAINNFNPNITNYDSALDIKQKSKKLVSIYLLAPTDKIFSSADCLKSVLNIICLYTEFIMFTPIIMSIILDPGQNFTNERVKYSIYLDNLANMVYYTSIHLNRDAAVILLDGIKTATIDLYITADTGAGKSCTNPLAPYCRTHIFDNVGGESINNIATAFTDADVAEKAASDAATILAQKTIKDRLIARYIYKIYYTLYLGITYDYAINATRANRIAAKKKIYWYLLDIIHLRMQELGVPVVLA